MYVLVHYAECSLNYNITNNFYELDMFNILLLKLYV